MLFRTKLNVLFVSLMIVFMVLSSSISYFVSKNIIVDNIKQLNENELLINIKSMESMINKSKDKFHLFLDDINFNTNFDNNILISSNDFNSELRTFLYTNNEFKGVFLHHDNLLIGTSLVNEVISYTETVDNRSSTQTVEQFLLAQLKEDWKYRKEELFEESLFIVPIKENVFFIAVLDYQKLLDQGSLKLLKLNSNNDVIYGEQQNALAFVNNDKLQSTDSQLVETVKIENQIVSMKNGNSEKYVLMKDITHIDQSFQLIVKKVAGYGTLLFFMFFIFSQIKTRKILSPINDFIKILKQVKGYETHEPVNKYIANYQEHSSAYKKLFMYFFAIIVPTLVIISISYHYYSQVIEENSRGENIQLFKQSAKSIESNLQSYHSYMRYLILNKELQELMVQANDGSLKSNRAFSDLLIRKGIINKDLTYISIYDANNRLVFSNLKNKVSVASSQSMLIIKKEIKYLSSRADKANIFDYLGYIEFGVEGIYEHQQLANRTSSIIFMNERDEHGNYQMISSPINQHYTDYLRRNGLNTLSDSLEFEYISINGEKTLFSTINIDKYDWKIAFFLPVSWEKQRYIFILQYALVVFSMLVIITIASILLGKSMTAPVRRAIHLMEQYPRDQSIRLFEDGHEFEFVILASKFNKLLSRLETLAIELKTKEQENVQMEKRVNKLLFKALQSQVNPHFLQNIFTSIMLLLKTGKLEEASDMLLATSKFLKTGLSGSRELVTVKEELEHVYNYVQIQNIRFENQLDFIIKVSELYHLVQIPKFILQPIVENAIHHALVKNQLLTISITCETTNEDLIIIIQDNGTGMTEIELDQTIQTMNNKSKSSHFGLSNVNERLSLEFGSNYGLEVSSIYGEGTQVKVKINMQLERVI
ncbi:sensor histidine kinase [Paenibacillus yanchengensis]|uniref:Sensor histidine kinase n=1 Tax=Paenibacillus yanchengensis TaxID=2035833 RepID=A0ABW4YNQ5_9BACL